jgi:hypothetical protein
MKQRDDSSGKTSAPSKKASVKGGTAQAIDSYAPDSLQRVFGNQAVGRALGKYPATTNHDGVQRIVNRASTGATGVVQRDWTGDWSAAVDENQEKELRSMMSGDQPKNGYEALAPEFSAICNLLKTDFNRDQAFARIEQFRVSAMGKKNISGIILQAANVLTEFVTAKEMYDSGTPIRPGAKPAQVGVSQPDYGFIEDPQIPNLPRDISQQVLGDAVIINPPRPPNGFPTQQAKDSAYQKYIADFPAKVSSDVSGKVAKYGAGTYVVVNAMAFSGYLVDVQAQLQAIKAKIQALQSPPGKVWMVTGQNAAPTLLYP